MFVGHRDRPFGLLSRAPVSVRPWPQRLDEIE
jgi:hypothetical protein